MKYSLCTLTKEFRNEQTYNHILVSENNILLGGTQQLPTLSVSMIKQLVLKGYIKYFKKSQSSNEHYIYIQYSVVSSTYALP